MKEKYYKPLTPSTWADFECAVGCEQGANGGCWCTWWRLPRGEWVKLGRVGRKQHFKEIVRSGCATGVIGFSGKEPYAWCAVAPVHNYSVVLRSRIIKPSLCEGDWYIPCFFVKAGYRRDGAMKRLLTYAIDFAKRNGAKAVEACPRDEPASSGYGDLFVGKTSVFISSGFREIHRLKHDRPLLRLDLPA